MRRAAFIAALSLSFPSGAFAAWVVATGGSGFTSGALAAVFSAASGEVMPTTTTGTTTPGAT